MNILALVFFGYGISKQLVLGQAFGSRPLPDIALVIVGLFFILLLAVLTYIFYTMRLITEVHNDSLTLRFHPLTHQIIPIGHIKKCEVRKYHPIREYGGWGIRYGRRGKAYTVSGTLVVQLELLQGKSILIGSQKPEELARAIQKNMHWKSLT
jgi:hypothetical protein